MKSVPNTAFIPFSGYGPADRIPAAGLKASPDDSEKLESNTQSREGTNTTQDRNESATLTNIEDKSSNQSTGTTAKDQICEPLSTPSTSQPLPMGKMQQQIKNAIQSVEDLRKSVYDASEDAIEDLDDLEERIDKAIDRAAKFIASSMKTVYNSISKQIQEALEKLSKKILSWLPVDKRVAGEEIVLLNSDNITCMIRRLIGGLLSKIKAFLISAIEQVINVPKCFVDTFIANFLGALKSGVAAIIGAMQKTLESIAGIALGALDIVEDVLGVIDDILSFLTCTNDPTESIVNDWSILGGDCGQKLLSKKDIDVITKKAEGLAEDVSNLGGKTAGEIGDVISDIQDDFEDVFDFTNCYTGPQECGTPRIEFFGDRLPYPDDHPKDSNGDPIPWEDAVGNVVVGPFGEALGIDIISFGQGYAENTRAHIVDNCGKGSGVDIYVDVEDGGRIRDIDIINPGDGYLPAPDGSWGGDGRTWKNPEDTVIKNGPNWGIPTPPGFPVVIPPGQPVLIWLPPGTCVVTEPHGEELCGGSGGGGLGGPAITKKEGTFTTPELPPADLDRGPYPSSDSSYPVIMYLCEIIIVSSGHKYKPDDEIVIEPSMGAEASLQLDEFGRVIGVKVTKPGEGFTEWPTIYIKSETGYNADLRPKLCIDRISSDKVEEGISTISVVDCVGRVVDC